MVDSVAGQQVMVCVWWEGGVSKTWDGWVGGWVVQRWTWKKSSLCGMQQRTVTTPTPVVKAPPVSRVPVRLVTCPGGVQMRDNNNAPGDTCSRSFHEYNKQHHHNNNTRLLMFVSTPINLSFLVLPTEQIINQCPAWVRPSVGALTLARNKTQHSKL